MYSPQVEWSCSQCQSTTTDHRKYCSDCHSMLTYTCISSGKSGLYKNFFRHRDSCVYCASELEDKTHKVEEKHVAIQQFQDLDNEQRPWSEWGRTNESCIQHTGHDIEQVEQLYSMCEQSLINYCFKRTKEQSNNNTSLLSPMNLLVVTLWYLKHYHSERYISTELNLSQSTINYFLTEVIDILHSCIYKQLVSLPADIADSTSKHGPEEYHKLIVDSTAIAIHEPYDSNQRKAYYHAKSSTNYAVKVQIACDFNHHIVHVSECYNGSVHDITVLRQSGLMEYAEESVQIIADKGYVGEQYVITPKKKQRGRELTDDEKNFNRDINSARAAIENIDQRLKTYAILGSVYRGAVDDLDKITKIIQVVAALCNLNMTKHPIRKSSS